MAIEPRLEQLLDSWEDLLDAGKTPPPPEEHCLAYPELLEEFRRLLRGNEWFNKGGIPASDGGDAARKTVVEATSRPVRFRVTGKPLQGGMGEVYPARDEELGRNVALKFIQRGKGGLVAERRFRREVAITGRLQHPGIVPVYGPAVSEDGRSGYAMRLIENESFDAAIARHHASGAAGEKKPTRAELLDHFEAVVNAMAYAHRHHVIHRDLKPSNVMLGKFGETVVVDWGLAKILTNDHAEQVASEEMTAMTASEEDSTREAVTADFAIGTYAYMPPEQANGDNANLDERADVFALGAMLCKILTGQPPYTGSYLLQQAKEADLADCFARLDASGIDAELIVLAKHCLQKSPTDRPRNAEAVWDAVRVYKAAVDARAREERERRVAAEAKAALEIELRVAAETTSALERGRRRATVALAVSVFAVLLVGGALFWLWQLRQAERSQQTAEASRQAEERDRDIQARLAEAAMLRELGKLGEAGKTLEGAEKLVNDGVPAALAERTLQARKDLDMVAELEEATLRGMEGWQRRLLMPALPEGYQKAFKQYGIDLDTLAPEEAAAKIRASEIRNHLLVVLDTWRTNLRGNQLLSEKLFKTALLADDDKQRQELTRPDWDLDKLEKRLERYDVAQLSSTTAVAISIRLYLLGSVARSEELLRTAQQAHPNDFWVNLFLFEILNEVPGRREDAIGFLRAAVAVRPDDSPVAHLKLGIGLVRHGRHNEAEKEFRRAVEIKPNYTDAHIRLGIHLAEKGDCAEAILSFQRALKLLSSSDDRRSQCEKYISSCKRMGKLPETEGKE